jgi:hypothetical protein
MGATGWSVFRGDLRRSLEAIGIAPMLTVLTVGLQIAFYISGPIIFLGLPLLLFEAGFVGTQRVWFERIYRGDHLGGREIVPLTRSFIGRFVVLGLLTSVAASPFLLLAHPPHERLQTGWAIVVVALFLVLDIGLTFVVPALSLTTRSVRDALRIGLLMIKKAWPTSAWYLLTPGLTLVLLSNAVRLSSYKPNLALRIALVASTTVLAVWFKGAIVAFYLRQPPAPPRRSTGPQPSG